MMLAVVQGRATSTVRHHSLANLKLLLCSVLGVNGKPQGDPVLAVDKLGAGKGEIVMISSDGLGLRELLGHDDSPARWYTLAIADQTKGLGT